MKRYDFLLKGMDDQRQRLRTGIYRASGRFVNDDPSLGRLDGPVRIFSAFDFDNDKFRFDRIEPIREGKITGPGAVTRETWTKKANGGRMIRLKDRTISNADGSFQVRSGGMTPAVEAAVKPLDVRAFGLFYWSDLTGFPATTYPKWLEYLERERPDDVVEERRGIWRITRTFPEVSGRTLRRILWLDQNSGFSPIRMELRHRTSSMPAGSWPEPKLESETSWVEIAGIWVPKTYRVIDKQSAPTVQSYELSFDWEAVNGEVPPRIFTLEGFELPGNFQVVDDSLGREIILGSVGVNRSLVDPATSEPPPPSPPRRAWQGWSSYYPYAIAAFGFGVIGIACWLRFRPS